MLSGLLSRLILLTLLFEAYNTELIARSTDPPFLKYLRHPWVDSVLKTLTLDQQIAQCIWIAADSKCDISKEIGVADIIRKYGVGGIIFFEGSSEKQAELTNFYQNISSVPLLITTDAEWGVGMRLRDVEKFPYPMTLGAIKNDSLIYKMGRTVAKQFKRLGMQMNLAPGADINVDPENPVINYRSFGETREKVSSLACLFMKGMQDNGIIATGKHFPGHGATSVDSHLDLPVINKSRSDLDSIELYPFRRLIDEGIGCIMVAHINIHSIDTATRLPSTHSQAIIKDLLIKNLGFKGLIVTDAMNMKGATRFLGPGEADAKALVSGNDVAEFVTDVESTINEVKNYISQNKIFRFEISEKCRKILALKFWSGLNNTQIINTDNIEKELSPATTTALIHELYANALTVLNNNQNIIPLKNIEKLKIASVAVNRNYLSSFQNRIADYVPVDQFLIDPSDSSACDNLLKQLSNYNLVIAGVFGLDQRANMGFGISPDLTRFLENLIMRNKTVITWFGNPYGINKEDILKKAAGLILAYQDNAYTEDISAQIIFGAIGAKGILPVTINDKWPFGYGIVTPGNLRPEYGQAENAGMSSQVLSTRIDSIANAGLSAKAFPGCVVMAARKGVVVFRKAYGFQTYDYRIQMREDDLFDLASVTKISSTLAGLMLLDSEGKFSPENTLGFYLPEFRNTDKGSIMMKDYLTHQAGLTPFIPFWKETMNKNGEFKPGIFNPCYKKKYPFEVAQGLYINKDYRKKIFNEIIKSPLGEKKYLYSDLSFIIAPAIIERLTGQKWHEFVADSIYKKLGIYEMGFNPSRKFNIDRIVPTEYDSVFRKQLIHGTVHDEGAAMLGGISGHAGLFSNANDLFKLMELYRRMGKYGGQQLIDSKVIEEYTKTQFPENDNRRGLGFDKPLLDNSIVPEEDAYPSRSASPSSFGHSGYTGTFVWVDPIYEITFVFLCNRIYPSRENEELYNMNIRSSILQVVYDSIIN